MQVRAMRSAFLTCIIIGRLPWYTSARRTLMARRAIFYACFIVWGRGCGARGLRGMRGARGVGRLRLVRGVRGLQPARRWMRYWMRVRQ